ncbi:hypothetical protein CKM354_001287000 [Cercospora kikuchii]|uniref:Polyketide synthase n=1 Tax=Cercospora kikuchii TaxID=84275 RepID=A0A9P3FMV0_9PEZI|nr:uncharacterized protein CKM354_001287000 [Cercospora kikuchii]GIZ49851.1 hypothetical protein CKM354_001287000 [Cercospora kikuchii]
MEPNHIVVYAFGDQTYDATALLSILLHWDDVLLTDFVDRVTRRLQQEVAELGPEQRAESPKFAKLLDLLPYWRDGLLTPGLCQALTCFTQIGAFLASHGYQAECRHFPTASTACLTGVCTGLISAAAVSFSTNVGELLCLGEESVAVAFRVGNLAADVGSRIANCRESTGKYSSWTAAVMVKDVETITKQVDDLDKQISSTPYISAYVSQHQVNVSAAPHTLRDFLSTLSPLGISSVELPVQAPYHAAHLYSESDVDQIIRSDKASNGTHSPRLSLTHEKLCIPIISSATGEIVSAKTFTYALQSAVRDCLLRTVRYDTLGPAIAFCIGSMGSSSQFSLQPVALGGPERLESAIRANLHNALTIRNAESMETLLERLQQRQRPRSAARSKIAILSCSGRFPRARNMDAFWDVLLHGIDTHRQVPESRWDARTHVSKSSSLEKNVSGTGYGCWLEDASAFDAKFFHVSPREAPQMDPAQRIALMCATEALEEAGVVPGRTPSTQHNRVGVYFGVTSNDWMETNSAQNVDTYFVPGGNRAFIPGRLNYHFKFSGPSYSIDTACSSSLTAIQLACNALWRQEIDMAVVGGTNILTNPDMHCGLDRGHFLSRTGNCKTFDATADGYCRGEAVAVVVLKRLEDAVIDHDPIQACILSVATNHSAEAESITRPHVGAQRELIDQVLREAGVSGRSIGYAEMHGTGTQAGDIAETNSVLASLAPQGARSSREPLYIGSAKANVGHGEAAAGITSLAKALLMLKHNTIPPHCGIKTSINPKLPDLASHSVRIATDGVSWTRPDGGSRRMLVNNFSAAGGNTALILEDPPLISTALIAFPQFHHSIVISAKTPVSLRQNVLATIAWIGQQKISDTSILPKLAYTTTARRSHHSLRIAVAGSNLRDIEHQLRLSLDKIADNRRMSPPKILFAFAGQGSEFPRMAIEFFQRVPGFRKDIEVYNRICLRMEFPAILALFKDDKSWDAATPQTLQLAAVCLQMALVRLWRSFGIEPTIVVGHSLGEYPSLYAAGVLSQSDVIYLVGNRAALMQQRCTPDSHAMLVVRLSSTDIAALLHTSGLRYEIACINGRRSVVLGGTKDQLQQVHARLQEQGIRSTELPLPYAFHTSQVDPILEDLDTLSGNVHFVNKKLPVISPTFAGIPTDFSSDFAVAHCREPVQMQQALGAARRQNLIDERTICIEIGSGAVTVNMVKEILGSSTETFVSMRQGEDVTRPLSIALAALCGKGANINWNGYHQIFSPGLGTIPLPAYHWDLREHWIQYTNDWSLRKGDAAAPPDVPLRLSSTIHKVVTDTIHTSAGKLTVESNLNRKDMDAVVQGHKVYGVPLCTPSVYADIALALGQHLKQHVFMEPNSVVEVAEMDIKSALVAISGGRSQILRTEVAVDRTSRTARCVFSSLTESSKEPEQHAHCIIQFHDSGTAYDLATRSLPDVLARVAALHKQIEASNSETYRFSKSMIYKMVAPVADFHNDYRGLTEIVLDNTALEATGKIEFKNPELLDGDFDTHPACIDALSQLGGFVMNANEGTDLNDEIYVNHGWRSLQIFNHIDPRKSYRSHVNMVEGSDKLWTGDVAIFDGDQLVAKFAGIALQRVPRRLMEYIVNTAHAKAAEACGIVKLKRSSNIAARTVQAEMVATHLTRQVPSFDAVLAIISSESGVPLQELIDGRGFDDLGVDSLLSLLIVSRVRSELAIELSNSIFLELGSVGALRTYMSGLNPSSKMNDLDTSSQLAPVPADIIWPTILQIISQEAGTLVQDLLDSTSLTDLGVDSLLSLVIASRLREELDINLPHVSLYAECDTLGCLRARIMELAENVDDQTDDTVSESPSDNSSSKSSWPLSEFSPLETPLTPPEVILGEKPWNATIEPQTAASYIIQGNMETSTQRLFLFPDGGGSATSYMKLPSISQSWAVVAFDSPFMRKPHLMQGTSLDALLETYLAALRQRQPAGPYHLGGWSAGGVLAYALASRLLAANEEVASLILIDSPSPAHGLDRLPQEFFDHCSKIGIFESEMNERRSPAIVAPVPPQWLIPHFHATIELLHEYHAKPLPLSVEGSRTSVTIIWAGACAFDDQKYPGLPDTKQFSLSEMEGIQFLTQRRTDFGAGKWAQLLHDHEVNVRTIEDEHHFSMMRHGASKLARIIGTAL